MANKTTAGTNSWIQAGDFEEVSYWITVKNTTTSQPIPEDPEIEVTEVSESGMTMKLPKKSCAMGHLLVVEMVRREKKPMEPPVPVEQPTQRMEVTAKIIDLEPLGKNYIAAQLQFYQFRTEDWRVFLSDYGARQKKLDAVIARIQGRKVS